MKKQILFLLFILLSGVTFGQIGIIDEDGNDVAGTIIDVMINSDLEHIETDFKTENLSTTAKTYNMKRYEIDYIEGSQEYYCWTLCLQPVDAGTDMYSLFPSAAGLLDLAAGASGNYGAPAFHFKPEGNAGEALYRYVIFNTADTTDSAYVDMHYIVGTVGINEYDNTALSNVFPNPANDVINVQSTIDNARFEIYTLVGTKVGGEQVTTINGKVSIDVSHLPNGVYMLSELESQITRRFIISR